MKRRSASAVIFVLGARTIATSTVVVAVLVAGVMRAIIAGYGVAGGAQGMAKLAHLLNNPAIRALYGVAYSVSTAGGFAVWRVSSFVALAVAIWAALSGTKVTRGAEDDGMVDLIVAEPVTRQRFLVTTAGSLIAASLCVGALAAASLATAAPLSGSILFGSGLGLVAMAYGAFGTVCAQLFAPRRRASEVAMALVGLSFALRMVVDAAAPNSPWRVVSPLLWFESLRTFAGAQPLWLLLLATLVVAALWSATMLFSRRDIGASVVVTRDRSATRPMGSSASSVSLTLRRGEAFVWVVGCAVVGIMMGTITGPISDFARTDPSYAAMLERSGYGSLLTINGFVAELAVIFALLSSLVVVAQLTSLVRDERDGRLDVILATGSSRPRWIGGVGLVAALTWVGVAIAFACGLTVGANATGSSLSLGAALGAVANVAPVVVLIGAVGFLVYGIWPHAATIATSSVIAVIGVITIVGPLLHWPTLVIDLSPLHHLALVPADPVAPLALVVMVGVAGFAYGVGTWCANRRDLL